MFPELPVAFQGFHFGNKRMKDRFMYELRDNRLLKVAVPNQCAHSYHVDLHGKTMGLLWIQ